ncbi:hypothetical protein FUA48_09375 [Flavobacterium alkalisoli]|uniref:HEAT repeat domain-containing protein n=1 Tax=Flavobacterium alkalisoli TaxID=2602769 RepID=A0A5B9FYG3_9FLAO|nr:HEAT repeat domain-containing protein [Flavobacterium alkalisoli]QEE49787.1 hypothetical protein FUA48_09375 [Flavobacterium alkalisoli]
MEQIYENIYHNDWEWIVKLNILVSFILLLLSLLLILFILYLRVFKNHRNLKKAEHYSRLTDFINNYLFDPDFDEAEIENFKNNFLKTSLQKKITTKEILICNQNFKGEANDSIKKLFFSLDLDNIVFKDLKSLKWHRRTRGLYTVSSMGIKIQESLAVKLLNDKRSEVRLQALLYFIKLSQKYPLNFLYRLEESLTIWQQVYLEDALKKYQEQVPDFSKWLTHKQPSVVIFCIKQIAVFNQYENIDQVMPFLESPEEELKRAAIRCMRKIGHEEAIDILLTNFATESNEIKKEILKLITQIGDFNQLQTLSGLLTGKDEEMKIEYLKAEEHFLK